MAAVRRRYINEQGVIEMAGCCGGDASLAQVAGLGIAGAPSPEPVDVGGLVRVQYVCEETGSIPFDFGQQVIRLGNNPTHRYADVTPQMAAWLAERVPIRVVPKLDPAVAPPEPLGVLQAADVLTPDADAQALKPKLKRGAA